MVAYATFLLVTACSAPSLADIAIPSGDIESAYWQLTFEYGAINLSMTAPYDTIQLNVIPRNSAGAPLQNISEKATFQVSDERRLYVDSSGLLKALAVGNHLKIVAKMTIGDVTHFDTTVVSVFPEAPTQAFDRLSIQPVFPDSAKWSSGVLGGKAIIPQFLDHNGLPLQSTAGVDVSGLIVKYWTPDKSRISIMNPYQGWLEAGRTGHAMIYAATYAFGVERRDSVLYTIGWPSDRFVWLREKNGITWLDPTEVTVRAGGYVFWFNPDNNKNTVTITFDDSTKVLPGYIGEESGNIESIVPGTLFTVSRQFVEPGIYTYRDKAGHFVGRVIVRDDEI